MFRRFQLQPVTVHDQPLDFEWDGDTGEIRGPSATPVCDMLNDAVKQGYIVSHPYPTSYDITDPYHCAAELAVILGQYWRLDDWLGEQMQPLLQNDDDDDEEDDGLRVAVVY